MLTQEQVGACVGKLYARFDAAKRSLASASAAYDRVVGNRIRELVHCGMSEANPPTAEELSLLGGKCILRFDGRFTPFLQLRVVTGAETFAVAEFRTGAKYDSDLRFFDCPRYKDGISSGTESVTCTEEGISRMELVYVLVGTSYTNSPSTLVSLANSPSTFKRLLQWEEAVSDLELRVRTFAYAIDAIDAVLKRLEQRYVAECETDSDLVLHRFGLCDGSITPKPMTLRVTVTEEGLVEAEDNFKSNN